ncbi:hypothetical protein AVEN_214609-1 [Araneus ventricosus]|uniref:Uncharacterized protein n=1 Tax=Araneus ventricosus TaxID=182803 RepID=A0A4Y2GLY0_ARAVE|nr:hypothetical protein AVEN_214609-1 [Araneus ventricosus]
MVIIMLCGFPLTVSTSDVTATVNLRQIMNNPWISSHVNLRSANCKSGNWSQIQPVDFLPLSSASTSITMLSIGRNDTTRGFCLTVNFRCHNCKSGNWS